MARLEEHIREATIQEMACAIFVARNWLMPKEKAHESWHNPTSFIDRGVYVSMAIAALDVIEALPVVPSDHVLVSMDDLYNIRNLEDDSVSLHARVDSIHRIDALVATRKKT